jgi:N-acyl-phosphatidylethanolamine-hydrolysing phospholipase D
MMHPKVSDSTPAHHVPGGGFRNPWLNSQAPGAKKIIKWMFTRGPRHSHDRNTSDDPSILPSPSDSSSPFELADRMEITAVGHSTFLIATPVGVFLTDPIWSDRASPLSFAGPKRTRPPGITLESITRLDGVLLSHDHYDHLDRRTVERLASAFPAAPWFAPLGLSSILQRWGVREVIEMDWWSKAMHGDFEVGCTPAQHFSGRRPWGRNASLWCGWTIEAAGYRIFFAGDTGLHPEFGDIARELGPFDIVIMPVGAYEPRWFMKPIHMNPEDAVSAYSRMSTGEPGERCIFLAAHWGTFKLTDEPLSEPPSRLRKVWGTTGFPYDRLWILAPGESRTLDQSGRT